MKTEREQLEARGNEVIEKRKDLLEKEENKFKSDRIEIEQTKEKFASAMKEQSKSIHHWKREIAKLELRDIPGEDKGELRVFQSEEDLGELASINIEKMDQELNVLLENL